MVILNRIYTRTGDDGTTALGTGERVPKSSRRVEAYGTVDETNAAIGLARTLLAESEPVVQDILKRIQNDLFDLGADLCVPERGDGSGPSRLRVTPGHVSRLEDEIDQLNAELSPLRSFVLPGGSAAAAQLHVARTVSRRAEREIMRLVEEPGEVVGADAIRYVNRLSDLLFVAARYVNRRGADDVLWVPGQNT